jgi:hypothetical protein
MPEDVISQAGLPIAMRERPKGTISDQELPPKAQATAPE